MRTAYRYTLVGPGSEIHIQSVQASRLRDFWIRVSGGPVTYTVDAYRSQEDANTQSSKLASGTCGAGAIVTATMTVAPGAPFDPTPMAVVFMDLQGTITSSVSGWVAGIQAAMLRRMETVFEQYRLTGEAMEGWNYAGIGIVLPANLPAYGIRPSGVTLYRESRDWFVANIGADLYYAAEGMDDPTVIEECIARVETLRSIALDEQMTWGGFATETIARGAIEPAEDSAGGRVVYLAILPLTIVVPGIGPDRAPGETPSGGGKYAAAL